MFMRNKSAREIDLVEDLQDIGVIKRIKEEKKEDYFSTSNINKLYK